MHAEQSSVPHSQSGTQKKQFNSAAIIGYSKSLSHMPDLLIDYPGTLNRKQKWGLKRSPTKLL
jgi:hypothetical protein